MQILEGGARPRCISICAIAIAFGPVDGIPFCHRESPILGRLQTLRGVLRSSAERYEICQRSLQPVQLKGILQWLQKSSGLLLILPRGVHYEFPQLIINTQATAVGSGVVQPV
ncbi:uncharacterized protein EAE98_008958 [Botrytis deweyae]|uniref:Uncharacterized protein n=1 Tax=Botrytis deweyae TaxID=2478750 RepID=A0ABQ7ICL0_9HELO|nr:uncharacterized protein EAE98_008958 [Botrytis deweyae]KAF7920265.1 hypothetical protein EAE98_008958 [Botrytis deweyae]